MAMKVHCLRSAPAPLALRLVAWAGALLLVAAAAVVNLGHAALIIDRPEIALGLWGANAQPFGRYAEMRAQAGERMGKVANLSLHASVLSALNAPAFTAAGIASRDREQAAVLLAYARQLSARDPVLLAALFTKARERGDAETEAQAIHAMGRLQLLNDATVNAFLADLARPDVRRATVAVMRDTGWRSRLLGRVRFSPGNGDGVALLVGDLAKAGAPLSRDEAELLVSAALYGNPADPALALRLWTLANPGRDPLAWPDGPAGAAFAWTPADRARLVTSGASRQLEYDSGDSGAVASSTLVLAPGRYRASLVGEGVELGITCANGSQRVHEGEPVSIDAGCGLAHLQIFVPAGRAGVVHSVALKPA